MDTVLLESDEWSSGPVFRAGTFGERLRGLRSRPPGSAVLLKAKSVHGIGMRHPFVAVGLTSQLEVLGVKPVRPGRVVVFPGGTYILELPAGRGLPVPGTVLEMTDG